MENIGSFENLEKRNAANDFRNVGGVSENRIGDSNKTEISLN